MPSEAEMKKSSVINLPKPAGPHVVGVVDFELEDHERVEAFARNEKRRIPVRAWYPAAAKTDAPRPYANKQEQEVLIGQFLSDMFQLPLDTAQVFNVPSSSYGGAQPIQDANCPVLIFSHGGFSYLSQNTVLMEHLASHGYVVLSISHPYLSSGVIHADGSLVYSDDVVRQQLLDLAAEPEAMGVYTNPSVAERLKDQRDVTRHHPLVPFFEIWVEDCLHAIDRVCKRELPEEANALQDVMDRSLIGTFGMSFGCSTCIAAHRDERVKATVNLDGGIFSDELIDTEIRVPTMIMLSDFRAVLAQDQAYHPYCEFHYERHKTVGSRSDVHRLITTGSSHTGYSDLALLPDDLKAENPTVSMLAGSVEGERMVNIMNDFTKAFFDKYLLNKGSGIDEALRKKYPEVIDEDVSQVREYGLSL